MAEPAAPDQLMVEPGDAEAYPVHIADGAWQRLPALLEERCHAHRYVVIADGTVARLYGTDVIDLLRAAGTRAELIDFPAGEASKSRERWAELTDRMLALGCARDTGVIALGGGVTGDLAGFVAATYMRGLPLVQLPTSLLAMVDSSVGGKTGVDTPRGKNLVGAFHQPRLVVADVGSLRTLPPARLREGLAEAVKHGAILDAAYFAWIGEAADRLLAVDAAALSELVERSVRIKADIVARDVREAGPRQLLNFGHTIGHAIEQVSGYAVPHGDAVAIGMIVESRIGERLGITEKGTTRSLLDVLGRFGLPTAVPAHLDVDRILAATAADKKVSGGRVRYALLEQIGQARWGVEVGEEDVRAGLVGE